MKGKQQTVAKLLNKTVGSVGLQQHGRQNKVSLLQGRPSCGRLEMNKGRWTNNRPSRRLFSKQPYTINEFKKQETSLTQPYWQTAEHLQGFPYVCHHWFWCSDKLSWEHQVLLTLQTDKLVALLPSNLSTNQKQVNASLRSRWHNSETELHAALNRAEHIHQEHVGLHLLARRFYSKTEAAPKDCWCAVFEASPSPPQNCTFRFMLLGIKRQKHYFLDFFTKLLSAIW